MAAEIGLKCPTLFAFGLIPDMGSVDCGRYGNRYKDCDELGGLRMMGGKFDRAID